MFKEFYDEVTFNDSKPYLETLRGKVGDTKSRGLYVTVIQNNVIIDDLTGLSMDFVFLKPDGTKGINEGEVAGERFRIDYTNQVFAVEGIVKGELVLRGASGEKITSRDLTLLVTQSIVDGEIISKDERGILDRAFELAEDMIPRIELIDIDLLENVQGELEYIKSNLPIGTLPTDKEGHPGNTHLIKGDKANGFYGFVRPEDMGAFESGKEYNGANLALEIGLSAGVAFNSNVPLMKFSRGGKVLFVPLTGYRHSVPWDHIYNAGAVYGTNDDGFLPPAGRAGTQLSIVAGNTIKTTKGDFLGDKSAADDYADTVGAVGDTLVLKDWPNEDNNKEVTITAITNDEIVIGETLIPEAGAKKSRLYNKKNVVRQNKTVTIGGKQYRVRLMKGAGTNPTDSYTDADRGAIGSDNEWNDLILPLHEHAKIGNWIYPAYAKNSEGAAIEDWGAGLTDEDLRTHNKYGAGSYTWCQENLDDITYRRVYRGLYGASRLGSHFSWGADGDFCFRPVLEAL